MRVVFNLVVLVWLVLIGTGCSLIGEYDETEKWDAAQLYSAAKEALDGGDYQKAIKYYGKLEARYPYGRYTQQAQLETAYAHYKADEPEAAIAAADRFIKLHPRSPNVDYAYYMRGLASFEPAKNFLETFFPQDAAKRDPASARESFRYFSELVKRYPDSKYSQDAILRMTYLRNNLARYEVMVADYYMRRGAYLSAANRAKYVLENYEKTPSVPDALVLMVKAYRQMQMDDLANDALKVLAKNYPERVSELTAK